MHIYFVLSLYLLEHGKIFSGLLLNRIESFLSFTSPEAINCAQLLFSISNTLLLKGSLW